MKHTGIIQLLMLVMSCMLAVGFISCAQPADDRVACTLSINQSVFKKGEIPQFTVSIKNVGNETIALPGAIDGSEQGWRYPHCRFDITRPSLHSVNPMIQHCGNVDPLQAAHFVELKPGDAFNPFDQTPKDAMGFIVFAPIIDAARSEQYDQLGTYQVQFIYSTQSGSVKAYGPHAGEVAAVEALLKPMPHCEVRSNIVEFQITE